MHLVLDDLGRDRRVDALQQRLEDLVAGLDALVELLLLRRLRAQVLAELLDRVELGGQLGELVVDLRQLADLDGLDRQGHGARLTGVLAAGQRRLEGGLLALGQAVQRLVHALEHGAGAHLVGDVGGVVDLLVVDLRGQVEGDEVALRRRAVDGHEGAEALPQLVQLLLHVLIRDLDAVDLDLDRVVGGQLDGGCDVDLDGDLEVALVLAVQTGHLLHLDLGLAQRGQVVLGEGTAVEVVQAVVDGLLQDDGAAHALVDDAGGDLAAAEARDVHLLRDLAIGLVDARLELGEGRLDAELDPGGVDGLDGALHSFPLVVCCGVRGGGRAVQQTAERTDAYRYHLRPGTADRTSCAIVLTQATDCRIRGARIPAGTALADPAPGPERSLWRRGPAARRGRVRVPRPAPRPGRRGRSRGPPARRR